LFIFRPRRLGQVASRARLSASVSGFILVAAIISSMVFILIVYESLSSYTLPGPVDSGATGEPPSIAWGPTLALSWPVFLICPAILAVVCAMAAWVFLVEVHRTGRPWASYGPLLQVASAGLWLIAVLFGVIGAAGVWADIVERRDEPWGRGVSLGPGAGPALAAVCIAAGLWLLISWMARAARGVDTPPPDLNPICEGCGYDLSHTPSSGICPECRLGLDESLAEGVSRPGAAWQRRPDLAAWLTDSLSVILQPGRFYGRLRLRDSSAAERRFATWHYPAIWLGAAVWIVSILVWLNVGPPPRDQGGLLMGAWLILSLCNLITLMGWAVKRLVAAVATTVWFAAGWIRDGRWAARVVAFETAFLWVFCAFNGLFVTSLVIDDKWLLKLQEAIVGHRFSLFGVPPEPLLVMTGNLSLIVLWLLRYRRILRAVQWNNF
jgi:hypothetical protein